MPKVYFQACSTRKPTVPGNFISWWVPRAGFRPTSVKHSMTLDFLVCRGHLTRCVQNLHIWRQLPLLMLFIKEPRAKYQVPLIMPACERREELEMLGAKSDNIQYIS